MSLSGNPDETYGYNKVLKNGDAANVNHVKAVIPPIGTVFSWVKTFGQADSGTTDGTTADKLVDTSQNFTTTAKIGMIVFNTTDLTFAYVTNVDSDSILSLSADIMTTGEDYEIYKTPNLPDAYVECNGQTLSDSDSPYDGEVIPDMNGSIQNSGTASSGGNNTLTDSGIGWTPSAYIGYEVVIISGTGNGQIRSITANTSDTLTVSGRWATNPDGTSVYRIITPPRFLRGYIQSGGTGGASTHYLTTNEMSIHNHSEVYPCGTDSHGTGGQSMYDSRCTQSSGSAGGDQAHENRPPYYDVVRIMRIK